LRFSPVAGAPTLKAAVAVAVAEAVTSPEAAFAEAATGAASVVVVVVMERQLWHSLIKASKSDSHLYELPEALALEPWHGT
jgi:hypothetical protein